MSLAAFGGALSSVRGSAALWCAGEGRRSFLDGNEANKRSVWSVPSDPRDVLLREADEMRDFFDEI